MYWAYENSYVTLRGDLEELWEVTVNLSHPDDATVMSLGLFWHVLGKCSFVIAVQSGLRRVWCIRWSVGYGDFGAWYYKPIIRCTLWCSLSLGEWSIWIEGNTVCRRTKCFTVFRCCVQLLHQGCLWDCYSFRQTWEHCELGDLILNF